MSISTAQAVTVQAYLRDSGNHPLTDGWLEIEADSLIASHYQSPKPLITSKPRRIVPDADGLVSVALVNSEDSGVTYKFSIGYTKTVTVPGDPTPTTYTEDVITDQFRALVPRPVFTNTGSVPVNLADLIPTGISLSSLDSSIARIAEMIVTDPILRSRAVQPFRITGVFNPDATYQYGDLVTLATVPTQTWVCVARSAALPAAAPTTPNWLRLL
jgi:hypothetical protein